MTFKTKLTIDKCLFVKTFILHLLFVLCTEHYVIYPRGRSVYSVFSWFHQAVCTGLTHCIQYNNVLELHQMLRNIFLEIKTYKSNRWLRLNFDPLHSLLFQPADVFTISPKKLSSCFVTTHFQRKRSFPFHYIAIVGRSHQDIKFIKWSCHR